MSRLRSTLVPFIGHRPVGALITAAVLVLSAGSATASPPNTVAARTRTTATRTQGSLLTRVRAARTARAQRRVARANAHGLGRPLDRRFVSLAPGAHEQSHDEYAARLEANGGRAQFVPLGGEVDPSRPAAFVVIGMGERFQDAHTMASELERGGYQVFISDSDESRSILDNAHQLSHAATDVMRQRAAIAARRGLRASHDVIVYSHSFGGAAAQLMLTELDARGALGAGDEATFTHVDFNAVDSPWRGLDLPWALRVPGAKTAFRVVASHAPFAPAVLREKAAMVVSLVNGSESMRALAHVKSPAAVTNHYVSVRGPDDTGFHMRYTAPLNNLYSEELFPGELGRLWDFLRSAAGADYVAGRDVQLARLNAFTQHGLTRTNGLANLARTLRRSASFGEHAGELARAAHEATSVEDFGRRWDAALPHIVPDLHGEHTASMWTDPRFAKTVAATVERERTRLLDTRASR